jgi:hypothetical protein
MKRPRSTAEAVNAILANKPKTMADFDKIGIPLGKWIGGGSFRNAYVPDNKRIVLVVKFPVYEDVRSGIIHSRSEVRKIKKLSRFSLLRKHLPKVYYHDNKSGIVVMHRYNSLTCDKSFDKLGIFTGKLIKKMTGVDMTDIQSSNVMSNGSGFVFIDLGY